MYKTTCISLHLTGLGKICNQIVAVVICNAFHETGYFSPNKLNEIISFSKECHLLQYMYCTVHVTHGKLRNHCTNATVKFLNVNVHVYQLTGVISVFPCCTYVHVCMFM